MMGREREQWSVGNCVVFVELGLPSWKRLFELETLQENVNLYLCLTISQLRSTYLI